MCALSTPACHALRSPLQSHSSFQAFPAMVNAHYIIAMCDRHQLHRENICLCKARVLQALLGVPTWLSAQVARLQCCPTDDATQSMYDLLPPTIGIAITSHSSYECAFCTASVSFGSAACVLLIMSSSSSSFSTLPCKTAALVNVGKVACCDMLCLLSLHAVAAAVQMGSLCVMCAQLHANIITQKINVRRRQA